jgi:uncharacterized membrane protein
MLAIFWPLVSWIFRGVVVKFVILTGLFAVMTLLIPKAIGFVLPYIGVNGLNQSFNGMDSGIWWYMDFFAMDYGIPLMISASVARFLIRRLPFIG